MRPSLAWWVLVPLCLTSWASAGAPSAELPTTPDLQPVRAELRQVVTELRRAGLPAGPVVRKVQEGAAKGVGAQRVLAAARGVAADVRLVARIARKRQIRPDARAEVIAAGVAAHRAGIPLLGIDSIVGAAPREVPDLAVVALHAAADLGGRGYPRQGAVDFVLLLLSRDQREAELPRALAAVEVERRATAAKKEVGPAEALSEVARRVETGQHLQEAGRVSGSGR